MKKLIFLLILSFGVCLANEVEIIDAEEDLEDFEKTQIQEFSAETNSIPSSPQPNFKSNNDFSPNLNNINSNDFGSNQGFAPDLKLKCTTDNNMAACYQLGMAYLEGMGIQKSPKKSIPFFKIACKQNYKDSCAKIAYSQTAIGQIHEENGVNKSSKISHWKALRYYNKACSLKDPQGCYKAGLYYESGKGGVCDQDHKEAQKLFKISCGSGYELACAKLK